MKSSTVLAITAALATTAVSAYEGGNGYHDRPDLSGPGIQVEYKPPVIVVETVTLTKSWGPRPTGMSQWKSNKYNHDDGDYGDDEEGGHNWKKNGKGDDDDEEGGHKWKKNGKGDDDDEEGGHKWNKNGKGDDDDEEGGHKWNKNGKGDDDDEEGGHKKWKKQGKGGDDYDDEDLHANSLAVEVDVAEASGLVDFAAAQASSGGIMSSAIASRTSSAASKMSSAVSSATSSASSSTASSVSGAENIRVGGIFVAAAAGISAYLLL